MEADVVIPDTLMCLIQEAFELSLDRNVSFAVQADAFSYIYQLMSPCQRDQPRFSEWFVDNLRNKIFPWCYENPNDAFSDGEDSGSIPDLVSDCGCALGFHRPGSCN
jgi:hypothetical protein